MKTAQTFLCGHNITLLPKLILRYAINKASFADCVQTLLYTNLPISKTPIQLNCCIISNCLGLVTPEIKGRKRVTKRLDEWLAMLFLEQPLV